MARPAAEPTDSPCPPEDGLLTCLARGLERAAPRLRGIEAGRLVSVGVSLPAERAAGLEPGGDTLWWGADRELRLQGTGAAARFAGDGAAAFRAACRRWVYVGADGRPPLAFFTLPPATEAPEPTLWVPRVLVRHGRGSLHLTLSAVADGRAPAEHIAAWLAEVRGLFRRPAGGAPPAILGSSATPDADGWRERVRQAVATVGAGRLDKVVLARRLEARLGAPADPRALVRRLAAMHPGCHVFCLPHGTGQVVAASPELLASRRGSRLTSHALAGTTRRHGRPAEDARAAAALLASAKDRQEHALVVDAIAARMAELCDGVGHGASPAVLPLRFVQHLHTAVAGRLRPGLDLLDAAVRLHPTPAVLGLPRDAARAWLAGVGECRDGLYSGVAGWIGRDGDGDAAVVLRGAYLEQRTAVLWAGAGIVAGSDPDAELAETELKLATMLEILNT